MDKIDLDAIISSVYPTFPEGTMRREDVKALMLATAHQALVLASEKAVTKDFVILDDDEVMGTFVSSKGTIVDKQSILDVENLIV